MRTVTVAVLSLVAALAAVSAQTDAERGGVLVKQQKILRLLYHVQQPTIFPEEREIAKTFKPIDHVGKYQNKIVVKKFWKYYTRVGFLPRGEVFSVYYEEHRAQAKALFELLYFAKDFDTFYKTAVWAREHISEGLFVYVLSVTVHRRRDTKYIMLPPPYEIYPQLYVSADVIQKAYDVRLRGEVSTKEQPYIFYANYSGYPVSRNREELVSYFTEDVGLSTFFALLHYEEPFWLGTGTLYSGQNFFFIMQQLLARYYLERLSNNLPDIKPIDYKHPVLVGYYPELRLQNGREAPARPEGIFPRNIDNLHVEEIENYERRIRDAIDLGFGLGQNYHKYNLREDDQSNIIGNIIEGNSDSVNQEFYGSVYRSLISLFGRIVDPIHRYGVRYEAPLLCDETFSFTKADFTLQVPPSVLEQPETQLRDPLFYRIVKRVFSIFCHYKNSLNPYTKSEIGFPGVAVESIVFDKLVTYFDDFDIEINNALPLSNPEEGSKVHFLARQHRLNHKPFYYHLKLKSDKEVAVLVRVFIGPKYDVYGSELSLEERKNYYFLFDLFDKKLVAGENDIKRSSEDLRFLVPEAPHFSDLYYETEAALRGEKNFSLANNRFHIGFPQRLALPRGTPSGLPLSVFVHVAPFNEDNEADLPPYKPNFPLDRRIVESNFDVPNMIFDETFVVFQQDINKTV